MRFFTEFIFLYENVELPDPTMFCKKIWKSENFDSDGDFYYENINNEWTELYLEDRIDDTLFQMRVYREKSYYNLGEDILFLNQFIEKYIKAGKYNWVEGIKKIKIPAVTSLRVETSNLEKYEDYLETCYLFLQHTSGILVSTGNLLEAKAFYDKFILPTNNPASPNL